MIASNMASEWRVARSIIRYASRPLVGFWVITVLIHWGIVIGLELQGAPADDLRTVTFTIIPSHIFLLVLGLLITVIQMPAYVAHGRTRRTVFNGATMGLLVVAAVSSVLGLVAVGADSMIAQATGLPALADAAHSFHSVGQALGLLLTSWLVNVAYYSLGWLIGSAFYRFTWWQGCLFVFAAVLTAIGMDALLPLDLLAQPFDLMIGLRYLGALGAIGATLALNRAVLRNVQLRRKLI